MILLSGHVTLSSPEKAPLTMTTPAPGPSAADAFEPDPPLLDLRTFVLLVCAVGAALLLYYKPATGLALLGNLTVLRALIHLVGRTQ